MLYNPIAIHNIPHTGGAVYTANTAAATAVVISWTDWLPPVLSAIATGMTIIWMGIQITVVIKSYLDKRELARGPRGKVGVQGEIGKTGLTGEIGPMGITTPSVIIKTEEVR